MSSSARLTQSDMAVIKEKLAAALQGRHSPLPDRAEDFPAWWNEATKYQNFTEERIRKITPEWLVDFVREMQRYLFLGRAITELDPEIIRQLGMLDRVYDLAWRCVEASKFLAARVTVLEEQLKRQIDNQKRVFERGSAAAELAEFEKRKKQLEHDVFMLEAAMKEKQLELDRKQVEIDRLKHPPQAEKQHPADPLKRRLARIREFEDEWKHQLAKADNDDERDRINRLFEMEIERVMKDERR